MHYRIPVYNLIAEEFDFTVMYSANVKKELLDQCSFNTKFLPTKKVWKFTKHEDNVFEISQNYDVVIALADISWVDFMRLSTRKNRKFKLLYWGIGVPASYHRKYGEASKLHYSVIKFFFTKADSLIFYSDYPFERYINWGYDKESLFAAHNTVDIDKITLIPEAKKDLLFIGTLYKEKGITTLLNEYLKAYNINNSISNLNIVGGGDGFEYIKTWIQENSLENKIHLLGPIYDTQKKAEIFSQSIASISPSQAGLAVLESMGHGVPFVTMDDAITGGESFNIKENNNGVILKEENQLHQVILDIQNNRNKYLEMGEKAYKYYWEYRKPSDMAAGAINAINNVLED